MRTKSHISLARYMVENLGDVELKKHRWSFYMGSILPDIKPSFLYERHEIGGTFPALSRRIERLPDRTRKAGEKNRRYFLDLGQISHYLADYFTYPHNEIYEGGFREHCSYEEELKHSLRSYLKTGEAKRLHAADGAYRELPPEDISAVCGFILKAHRDYIDRKHGVEDDIRHIVEVNQWALAGMLRLSEVCARRMEGAGSTV